MTSLTRRPLTIDDPLAAREVCHVAHPSEPEPGRLQQILLNQIHRNPNQPRKRFDEASLAALADSIRERGVLQPIIIQPRDEGGYEIVAGERRWRAAHAAGLDAIPALIDEPSDPASSLETALIENMVRENLGPIEEAQTVALLLDALGVTAGVLATRLGRSRTDLVHTVRLLDLPDQVLDLIDSGALSKSHGKALLVEPDHARRRDFAKQAVTGGWSVRTLEAQIAQAAKPRPARREIHPDHDAAANRLQDALTTATGADVRVRPHPRGFQLLIDHASAESLAEILARKARHAA